MTSIWLSEKFTTSLVSVIIPTYNRQDLLKEAVLSIAEQTYRPIECIVVDDGSTDGTAEVMHHLEYLQTNDFSLKYIVQQNAGSQAARNNGTVHSSGEFIQYLDSDDLLYPEKLDEQVAYLQTHTSCDGVFGDWRKGTTENNQFIEAYEGSDMILQLLTDRCIANFSFLMRRVLISKIGEWDPAIKRNQEIDYHLRGLLAGASYRYLPGATGLWRDHEGERIFNKTKFSTVISFYTTWERRLKQHMLWGEAIQTGIANNYIWFLQSYPGSDADEMLGLLKELYRLHPDHPIFTSVKFKVSKLLLGIDKSLQLWIARFQSGNKKLQAG
jgi:glycosyltransferase involved in cell wall biosynthesis